MLILSTFDMDLARMFVLLRQASYSLCRGGLETANAVKGMCRLEYGSCEPNSP